MSRSIDDAESLVESRVLVWAKLTGRTIRIDVVGVLRPGGEVEAVVTDLQSGRQGIWPRAWEIPREEPLNTIPLFSQMPVRRKKQGLLF